MVVWDLKDQTPKVYKQWIIPTLLLNGVEWTPDGKYIILGGAPIIIFSTEDGSILNKLDAPYSGRFAISSDGKQLFVPASVATANSPYGKLIVPLGKTDTSVSAYTIPELVKIHDFTGRIYSPETVDISPSGNYLVAGDDMSDGFEVWETQSQKIVNSVYLGSHWNDDLEFSPNGEMFAALGRDNKVRLYNPDNGALLETVDGFYPGFIEDVYWSSDGTVIAWQGEESDLRRYWQIWDMKTNNKELGEDDVRSILKIGALQNQKKVATITSGRLLVWTFDEKNNEYSKTANTIINNSDFWVRCVDWSPDYERLAVCDRSRETEKMFLEIFTSQLQTLSIIEEKRNVDYYILGWSPDGKWLATIDSNYESHGAFLTVRSADSLDIHFVYKIESANDVLSWSPDGNWLITISSPDQYGLTIYPVDGKGKPLQIIQGTGRIDSVDWSPDGKYIVVSGANGIIYLYNAEKILDEYFPLQK
jgi:WD40 repeat protein